MCGILGLIHNESYFITENNFNDLNNINYNRGPDNQNTSSINILSHTVKIGHTRLSIQDLTSNANQPMTSFNGRFVISFNGEIYNHKELRKKIAKLSNINWNSNSDTETLLNLFEFFKFEDVLQMLEGMFSFILLDKKTKTIHIARDLAGEKPLYMYFNENLCLFSSDLQAIIKIPSFKKDINHDSLQNFLEYNYVPSPNTIFQNVFKLPASSFLSIDLSKFKYQLFNQFNNLIDNDAIKFDKWWQLNLNKNEFSKLSSIDAEKIVHNQLKLSVKQQLLSDVPLGAFLSAGIDSSLIVSLMQELQAQTKTFTIGFEDEIYDESVYANKIAEHLSTDHENYKFSNSEVINYIENITNAYSEPFADSSQLPTLLVSKIAKEKVKVVLTGDGGDELFGGYNRYIYANKYWKFFNLFNSEKRNKLLLSLLEFNPKLSYKVINYFLNSNLNNNSFEKIKNKLMLINNEYSYYNSLTKEWNDKDNILNREYSHISNEDVKNIFNNSNLKIEEKMMIADFNTYLPDDILCKVDRATMHFSLESRAPFLSKNLIELAMNLPLNMKLKSGNSKIILKNILQKYLPDNLINKHKKGFGIPLANLFRTELKTWVYDNLVNNNSTNHNFFNNKLVEKFVDEHMKCKANHQYKLWSLLQFNLWYNNFYKS